MRSNHSHGSKYINDILFPGGSLSPGTGFESRQRYSSGYIQCMHEVHNLLLSCPGMDKTLGARLLNHLLKSLPHISTEAGGTTSDGTPGPLPLSPTQSPLNPPSLHPHSLHLHTPPTPSPPSSPTHSPRVPPIRERPHEQSSPPRSLSPQSPARSALPPFFPGADPSMWRPWWMNVAQPPHFPSPCPSLACPLLPNSFHYIWSLGRLECFPLKGVHHIELQSPMGLCGII